EERLLRNLYRTDLPHPFLSLLLLFQQLTLTADVTAITFRGHVLTQCADGLAGNDLGADSGLDGDLELLTRQQLLELFTKLAAKILRTAAMDQGTEGIYLIAIEQDIHLDDIAVATADGMIIERGISAGLTLQLVVEI